MIKEGICCYNIWYIVIVYDIWWHNIWYKKGCVVIIYDMLL